MLTKLSTSLLLATSLVACMRGERDDLDSAESALDSQESVEAEGNVMMASLDGADATSLVPATADEVAARVAANVNARFAPSGCAAATAAGANVAVTYDDCTGPYGLVHVSGELDLVISVALDGAISAHGTATDLHVNRAAIDVDADATLEVGGTSHQLTVHTQGSGTGPRGNIIDHAGDYTVSWDTATQCGALAGTWSTELTGANGSAHRGNTVDLERCTYACATGSIVHTGLGGTTLTITLDGSGVASWSTSDGRSGTVEPSCD
jgi:hypothetical protein